MDDFLREPDMRDLLNSGTILPQHTTPQQWECRRDDADLICLYDGQRVYTFRGQLDLAAQSHLNKTEDLPYAQFMPLKNKCAATVHRSSPGSIYFTLNDGRLNQTFTLRHASGPCWVAVPKARRNRAENQGAEGQQGDQ